MTVPVAEAPPLTEDGLIETAERAAGAMVKVAVLDPDPLPAVIVAETVVVTTAVVTVKFAVVAPTGTVTVDGTTASVLLDARGTTTLLTEGAADKVTVPVELPPPPTDAGLKVTPVTVGVV